MVTYVHHLPGRLRIRSAALKGKPATARRARETLASIPGIARVRANPLTGSLTVHYEPHRLSHDDLSTLLQERGWISRSLPARETGSSGLTDRLAEHVVNKAASALVEKLLERMAFAVIGALV